MWRSVQGTEVEGSPTRVRCGIMAAMVTVLVSGHAVEARAVDSGKLIEKDGQYVFVESMDPSVRLLLERALQKGLITQEEYDKAVQESETRAYLMQPSYKMWYDRGFNFSMNDNAFLLKIRARLQFRETTRWRNKAWRNPGDAKNFPELLGVFGDYRANRSDDYYSQFNLRRARLLFLGHLINPESGSDQYHGVHAVRRAGACTGCLHRQWPESSRHRGHHHE